MGIYSIWINIKHGFFMNYHFYCKFFWTVDPELPQKLAIYYTWSGKNFSSVIFSWCSGSHTNRGSVQEYMFHENNVRTWRKIDNIYPWIHYTFWKITSVLDMCSDFRREIFVHTDLSRGDFIISVRGAPSIPLGSYLRMRTQFQIHRSYWNINSNVFKWFSSPIIIKQKAIFQIR